MEIQIGKWGRITAGNNVGLYIFVQDDSDDSGGFLIFQSPERVIEKGFDNWVEDHVGLEKFFEFAGWKVEWD